CNKNKKFSKRQIILLDGPLGVGKTQFVKKCVEQLGAELPDSPTFSIINSYQGAELPIYHVDLYRLESEEDIESTGFWDLFREESAIIFIEWAHKISNENWPKSWDQIRLEISFTAQENERDFNINRV
ncbi:tRNA (adenosine(37)-N6)-threonylcarbamoyltransferase complex ATPase subunit type 1 TsaE, partial [bacterium]|nr:tRNA (adenosine(37)-N6)-threonylcarbamoyltransferase complex ATPase subunit type 1 TsaE [bacterium]